jgi:hypothetical protein
MCKFADTNQLSNDLNISFQLRQFEGYNFLQNYRVKNKVNNINTKYNLIVAEYIHYLCLQTYRVRNNKKEHVYVHLKVVR